MARSTTLTVTPVITTQTRNRDAPERSAIVPLDSPVNASPSTGRTGAPQPTTLHGIVLNPSVLKIAPINPPREPRPLAARLSLLSWARLSSHSVE